MRISSPSCAARALRLFVFLMGATALAFAQQPSGVPVQADYPWKPAKGLCTGGLEKVLTACDPENWPSEVVTRERLETLYTAENWALLERALGEIVASGKRYESGVPATTTIYSLFRKRMGAPGMPSAEVQRVERWMTAYPKSSFATYALARTQYAAAWNLRGAGYSGSVSKESWELFEIGLQRAEKTLLNAPQALKDTPLWYHQMLAISLDLKKPVEQPLSLLERAGKKWPDYYGIYLIAINRLVPQWGGSWEEVDAAIGKWSTRAEQREGKSLYARLYFDAIFFGHPAHEMAINWPRMKVSLQDLTKRYPAAEYKNFYANLACVKRDKKTFAEAMQQIPRDELFESLWLNGHSYEACMRWAAS